MSKGCMLLCNAANCVSYINEYYRDGVRTVVCPYCYLPIHLSGHKVTKMNQSEFISAALQKHEDGYMVLQGDLDEQHIQEFKSKLNDKIK